MAYKARLKEKKMYGFSMSDTKEETLNVSSLYLNKYKCYKYLKHVN